MTQHRLPYQIDSDKIFLVNCSRLLNRLDPIFYNSNIDKFISGAYSSVKIKSVIISMKSGIGAGKNDQTDAKSGIIQIRPTNIDENGFLKFDKNIFIPDSIQTLKLQVGDVLFNNTNSQEWVGKTALLKEKLDLSCSNHITCIRVDKNKILPEFLWLILNVYQRNKIFYSICTNWNNQSGVGIDLLKSLEIPLPSLDIQQEMVSLYQNAYQQKQQKELEAKILLESIDEYLLKELDIKSPEKDNSLEKRVFITKFKDVTGGRVDTTVRMLSKYQKSLAYGKYKITKLGKVVNGIRTGSTPHASQAPYVDTGILFLRNSDIYNSEINFSDMKYVRKDLENELTYSFYGEIIICIAGTIGISAINNSCEKIAINQNVTSIDLKQDLVNKNYLNYFFNSQFSIDIVKIYSSIATILYINNNNLLNLRIPLPPLEKQNQIANHIHQIRSKVKLLKNEANKILEDAKQNIEKMILS